MEYTYGKAIKELLSPDGSARLDIVARNDGVFQVFEQLARPPLEGGWHPGKVWGLYETAEAAEEAARAHIAGQEQD